MSLKSWFPIPGGSHFSLANIPFGIISTSTSQNRRPAVAIGDYALDLEAFTANNGFSACSIIQPHQAVFSQPTLNAFAALGRPIHSVVRKYIQSVFSVDTPHADVLKSDTSLQKKVLVPLKDVETHLPMQIGDYTDFYAGRNHAFNVGSMFRGKDNALQPNYNHLPVGYHGRASSVVVSGTPIRRPQGQILENPTATAKQPILSPCKKLDIELELGAFVCRSNKMGEPIPIGDAEESLFGMVLMNDWSARDIQAWEYVPLGPFNAKNFGTTISPWVVLFEAMEPFLTKGLLNETELLPYLKEKREDNVYDIQLEVDLTTKSGKTTTITRTSSKNLLFSFPQMLAHHSITGCPMNVGDLLGSGTISGTQPSERGALLEQTWNGRDPIKLQDGEERIFLEDGDIVTIKGVCGSKDDGLVGFGECVGTIDAAVDLGF
ncbi:MAG: hypothetical protein M1822_009021 [Bathelium mastoideum]|nr:MAG: hypothetical protein M1822_009021 [Bathelium mastoideum]